MAANPDSSTCMLPTSSPTCKHDSASNNNMSATRLGILSIGNSIVPGGGVMVMMVVVVVMMTMMVVVVMVMMMRRTMMMVQCTVWECVCNSNNSDFTTNHTFFHANNMYMQTTCMHACKLHKMPCSSQQRATHPSNPHITHTCTQWPMLPCIFDKWYKIEYACWQHDLLCFFPCTILGQLKCIVVQFQTRNRACPVEGVMCAGVVRCVQGLCDVCSVRLCV